MAKKKHAEEHENLERWLVSYADFMTLLFATFVVLYALSQIDAAGFKQLEESIKESFKPKPISIMAGSDDIMNSVGENIVEGQDADSIMPPIVMEYLSQKYEQDSYEEIKKQIDSLAKTAEYENISATIDERGLVIKFNNSNLMFSPASAELKSEAYPHLNAIAKLISKKFKVHLLRIEGHTDNQPLVSPVYPSNWELSGARASTIVRYFISKHDFNPSLFSSIGFSDTRPIADNNTEKNRSLNRRVEIIVLRNKYKKLEYGNNNILDKKIFEEEKAKAEKAQALQKANEPKYYDTETPAENKPASTAANLTILNTIYSEEGSRVANVKKPVKKMLK